jgi:rubrerythrin
MNEEFNPQIYELTSEEYNDYIKKLKEQDKSEIEKIITRYISYKPEMTEAALYVAVEKGIISYDLKEKISGQIRLNYSEKSKAVKQAVWERQNAFSEYIAGYNDDQIYDIIDNPSDIVIDVYHAVLVTAVQRELISQDDFNNLFKDGLMASRSEAELRRDRFNELYRNPFVDEPELTDEQIEVYKSKYWKCPACGELVENNFDICWKCQTDKPEKAEQPDRQEIIRELKPVKNFSLYTAGFSLIGAGILVFLGSFVRYYSRNIPWDQRYFTLAFSGLFVILGIGIIILGITDKSKRD